MSHYTKIENSKIHTNVLAVEHIIYLDEDFSEPAFQRDVINLLKGAYEGDKVTIRINSGGGAIRTALPIINAMRESKAEVTTELLSDAHSAASMVLLSGDIIYVNPHANMLIHSASFGTWGKTKEVEKCVAHTIESCEELFRDIYQGFLSEEEMGKVLSGVDKYLKSSEIIERLQERFKVMQSKQEEFLKANTLNEGDLMKMTKKELISLIMES